MKISLYSFVVLLIFLTTPSTFPQENDAKEITTSKASLLESTANKKMSSALTELLADLYLLSAKTQKYHWNVQGKHFGPLHELFGAQYKTLATYIDRVAERIRALGFLSIGTLEEFKKISSLTEAPGKNGSELEMIQDLLNDHEKIITAIRSDIELSTTNNDAGTNNMLADLIEQEEKIAWMLRAHLLNNK